MLSSRDRPIAALFSGDELWESSWSEAAGEATIKKRMLGKDKENVEFALYSSWFCPFAQRAWIVAEESNANYQWVEINPYIVDSTRPGGYTKKAQALEQKKLVDPDFVEASPRGLVPAIRHKGIVLWESLPVCEYIDSVFGNGTLIDRTDPYQVARQQIWCSHCTDRIQKKYYQALNAQEENDREALIEEFFKECRVLSNEMSNDGPYFNGKKFSMVDVALAPFWQRVLIVGPHYFDLNLPKESEFQRLDIWWNAVSARPSVAATIVCEPRLISSYMDYYTDSATSDAARNYIK
mmetsp:Transcript_23838/g.27467  ORF Transcript_23838/g.27467 Transcript_23838/m.27467 type:complete len:294 (+) Transcript_23838:24-905(+)